MLTCDDGWRPNGTKGICDRCGFAYRLSDLRREWTGLKVCAEDFDPRPADLDPPRYAPEGTPVRGARPDLSADPDLGMSAELAFLVQHAYNPPLPSIIVPGSYVGPVDPPVPPFTNSLDFSDVSNSGYLALLCPGVGVPTGGGLDFSDPANSGLLALFGPGMGFQPSGAGVLDFSDANNSGLIAALSA